MPPANCLHCCSTSFSSYTGSSSLSSFPRLPGQVVDGVGALSPGRVEQLGLRIARLAQRILSDSVFQRRRKSTSGSSRLMVVLPDSRPLKSRVGAPIAYNERVANLTGCVDSRVSTALCQKISVETCFVNASLPLQSLLSHPPRWLMRLQRLHRRATLREL